MIREEGGRSVLHCDRCPVRLDLGPAAIVQQHLRMPSSWIRDAPDHHLCPTCFRKSLSEAVATPD
ncbi:MAG TPA: hypothetical protein VH300_16450 [Thermoleophilaceae bacterium]|nr:hypothetical protein [Thermoleophilaceae bacterium]